MPPALLGRALGLILTEPLIRVIAKALLFWLLKEAVQESEVPEDGAV